MLTRRTVVLIAVAAALGASGCRSPGGSGRSSRPERPASARSQYLIEGDELKVVGAQNLYDVVRIQRPFWITRAVRNRIGNDAVAVYLDERVIGSLNILRELPVQVAARLQYLSPTEAQLRFGPLHGSRAAIVVVSARS